MRTSGPVNIHGTAPAHSRVEILGSDRAPVGVTMADNAGNYEPLLKMAATAYRSTGHCDVLPVALGMWAEAERRCSAPASAITVASEAADLLEQGAPSLLNESAVYLALHDALLDAGEEEAARRAVARGMAPLLRRLHGLVGTTYARQFLTELPQNAALLAAAEGYGVTPDEIHRLFERGAT